jgi:hypothetical protein
MAAQQAHGLYPRATAAASIRAAAMLAANKLNGITRQFLHVTCRAH